MDEEVGARASPAVDSVAGQASQPDFGAESTYAATRLPVALASTLRPEAYTSAEFFALEQDRIFRSGWVAVGLLDELRSPGDAIVVPVAGQSIILVRDEAGALGAFVNVCRHRGAELLDQGACRLPSRIRCPYHSWTYGLDGRLLGTPLFDEESAVPVDQRAIFDMGDTRSFDRADYGLFRVAVEAWGCLVLVNLDPEPSLLADSLGDLDGRLAGYRLDEWRIAATKGYEIDANYKLIAENFMEYYHLPWVHPGLVKVSPLEAHHRWQGPGRYTGMCTRPIAPSTEDGGWLGLPPVSGLSVEDAESARFVWLFPNVAVNVLPNHLFVILTRPVSATHTSELTYLLVHPEADGVTDREELVGGLARFWDEVNLEDVEIVERVQRGLANSRYRGGRMCYRFEEPLHRFQNMVVDRMVGRDRVPVGDDEYETRMFTTAGEAGRTEVQSQ